LPFGAEVPNGGPRRRAGDVLSRRIMTKRKPAAQTFSLNFPQLDREIAGHSGETIYQSARRSGVRIIGACGARGTCGTCRVLVVEGEIDAIDEKALPGGGKKPRWVRACQVMPRSDCVVEIAERSLAPVVRAEFDAGESVEILALDPAVVSREVKVPEATLADNLSDLDRVIRALASPLPEVDLIAARQLPTVLRGGDWSLRAHIRERELIGFSPADRRMLGLAVDLGTTNVAGFLVDLQSGARVASLGIENPQAVWGADVISRMNHAIQSPGSATELRQAAATAINALAHDLCFSIGAATADIVDVAICGNTAMHHLLLGLPVRQLGRAPFVAAVRNAIDVKARELDLTVCPGAYVHLAPIIGGFVGSDHVTALLATQEHWRGGTTTLIMDIGTNTEISLIHSGDIMSASCPSGPALEGGHISCGMRAAEGAIERVVIKDGRIEIDAIGNRKPVGLCGSGVIDAMAALRELGILDDGGRIVSQHPDVIEVDGKREALLAPGVAFNQHDVRAVQLAKAAIRTGIELLLRDRGLHEHDIGLVVIAGAFGSYINVGSAIAIGLLPVLPLDRFKQVGNAAGVGVRQILASRRMRAQARELAQRCRYVELSTRGDFQKTFLHNIGFKSLPNLRRAL
jgi:uncharacterized 2Fe-2S/4Fe-4S cluster protein (DUF4445 family)